MPNGAHPGRGRGRASVEPGPTPAPWRSAHLTLVDSRRTLTGNTPNARHWITAAFLGTLAATRGWTGRGAVLCSTRLGGNVYTGSNNQAVTASSRVMLG